MKVKALPVRFSRLDFVEVIKGTHKGLQFEIKYLNHLVALDKRGTAHKLTSLRFLRSLG